MTTEAFLSELLGFLAQWGPLAIGAAVILSLLVFGLALAFIIGVWRSLLRDEKEFDARWNRTHGRRW